jgi:hypothetical protein
MVIHIHISTLRGTFHEYTSKLIIFLILQFIVKREKKIENLTSAPLLKVAVDATTYYNAISSQPAAWHMHIFFTLDESSSFFFLLLINHHIVVK